MQGDPARSQANGKQAGRRVASCLPRSMQCLALPRDGEGQQRSRTGPCSSTQSN